MNYYRQMKKNILFDFIVNEYIEEYFLKEIEDGKSEIYILPNRKKKILEYMKNLRAIVKKGKYDIIHIHGNSSLMMIELLAIIGLKGKKNFKVIVHNHAAESDYKQLDKIIRPFFYGKYDKALTVELNESYLFKKNYEIAYNGIASDKFKFNGKNRINIREKLNIKNETMFLHVGRFSKEKNHLFVLDVFEAFLRKEKNAKLVFVGRGPLEAEIKNIAMEREIRESIFFVGDVENIECWYSSADVCIFPSKVESFGLVAVEAQMNSLPCICSNHISKKLKKTNRIEFLDIDTKNVCQWVEQAELFSKMRKDRLSQDIPSELMEFDIENTAKKMLKNYESLLQESI